MSKLYDLLNTLITNVNASVKTTAQTLTEAQKVQARQNIGAAAVGEGGGGINVSGAVPGQTIVVKEVDANGTPTAWEPVDFPEGGGTTWEDIGSKFQESVIFPEASLTYVEDIGGFVIFDYVPVESGNTYIVNWNGVEYVCTAFTHSQDGMTATILGDIGVLQGAPTTGEPFFMMFISADMAAEMGVGAQILAIDGSMELTLSITGKTETITPIPQKYIPPSDWNASEGEIGHILNRTHYTETIETDFPETEIPVDSSYVPFMHKIPVVGGYTYTVTWNGTVYESKALTIQGETALGNMGTLGYGPDTGEPFIIMLTDEQGEDGSFGQIVCFDGSTVALMSIKGKAEIIHKLPGKYVDINMMDSMDTIDLLLAGAVRYGDYSSNPSTGTPLAEQLKKGFAKVSFYFSYNGEAKKITVLLTASTSTYEGSYAAFGTVKTENTVGFIFAHIESSGRVYVTAVPAYTAQRPGGLRVMPRTPIVMDANENLYGLEVDENGVLQTFKLSQATTNE